LILELLTLMTSAPTMVAEACCETEAATALAASAGVDVAAVAVSAAAAGGNVVLPELAALPTLKASKVSKKRGRSRRRYGGTGMSAVRPVAAISLWTSASRCSEADVFACWLSRVAPVYLQQRREVCLVRAVLPSLGNCMGPGEGPKATTDGDKHQIIIL
jgi:hypothetical protein